MNGALMVALLRQRMTSPVRVVLLVFLFGFPLLGAWAMQSARGLGDPFMIALVLGAGAIGQDLSSGVLQLTFARPVSRSSYVLSKWAAIALASAGIALVQLALGFLLLSSRGEPMTASALARSAGETVASAAGVGGVIVLFSSLLPGLGDLALFLLLGLGGSLMGFLGQARSLPTLAKIGQEMSSFAVPHADLSLGSPGSVYALVAFASNLALALALAIVVLNRRELSYASD